MRTHGAFQETRLQGTLQFPCTMYFAEDVQDAGPFEVKPHWHNAIEILHLERGTFQAGINTEQYTITEETFFFVESGMLHTLISEKDYKEQAILFDPALPGADDAAAREIVEPLMQGRMHFPRKLDAKDPGFSEVKQIYQFISELFLRYGEEHEDQRHIVNGAGRLKVKAALLFLTAVLSENGLIDGSSLEQDPRMEPLKEVLTFIREHYQEKIYLSSLAGIMNMNEQYFCRFFHRITRRTPVTYINEIRIRQACELLRTTDLPVLQIAGECGYGNVGHFTQEFKKLTGFRPSAYRRNI